MVKIMLKNNHNWIAVRESIKLIMTKKEDGERRRQQINEVYIIIRTEGQFFAGCLKSKGPHFFSVNNVILRAL